MAFIKQKISAFELFYALSKRIIESPELFPNEAMMLEQGTFTASELQRIKSEKVKLAIVYARIYTLELSGSRKIRSPQDVNKIAYGQALLSLANAEDIDFSHSGTSSEALVNTIDGYTMRIAQGSDGEKYDDYYLAFQHFQDIVFSDKKGTEIPLAAVTIGKYIREHVSKMLVDDLLKNHKVT